MGNIFVPAVLLGDLVHAGLEDFLKKEFNAEVEVEGEKEIQVNGKAIKVKGSADAIINQNGEGIMENTSLPLWRILHYDKSSTTLIPMLASIVTSSWAV